MDQAMSDEEAAAAFESDEFEVVAHRDRSATEPIRAAVGALTAAVADARSRGVTWAEIAAALGVSHREARERYGPLV